MTAGSKTQIILGLNVAAGGLAHFIWPRKFEPLNRRLGFTNHTRTHVYCNGAIETAIGLTLLSPTTHRLTATLSVAYPIYLATNTIRARRAGQAGVR
ncbi:hypothetical protein [Mycobacterium sp. 3519A]|uniref:hypothetical protein n=1 Tax=Mycobacterium sp. 3519A TaxID=2057184 RepID=UPI000C7D02D1|nr:hypothetical protein [Mycobacterium sp. 3519A]